MRCARLVLGPLSRDTVMSRACDQSLTVCILTCRIHSRKMQVSPKVNFEELARSTDEFNGAQLKATCVEAGMIALREGAKVIGHEHYLSGILEVQVRSFVVSRARAALESVDDR